MVTPTPAGRLGRMICFEHAFPDVATALALRGAQILVVPSAVPFGDERLLTLPTRARAQDNQVFAVGCNLAGIDRDREPEPALRLRQPDRYRHDRL